MLLTNWLTELFHNRTQPRSGRRQTARRASSQHIRQAEVLEDRTLLVNSLQAFFDGNNNPTVGSDPG
ncbi:hypothetical protein, partial [Thalassoroseus pseudoceratinae]|uniref:hypothetical protein n=1 Tax=Thalassoroseus pseudoceratinae TaxID=2713176 RepID=UPI00141FE61A